MLDKLRSSIRDYLLPPMHRSDRMGALYRAWGHVFTNYIRGAYYEFGVYRGDSFRASWRMYQMYARWVQTQLESPERWRREVIRDFAPYPHEFYAFDTFEGMPVNQENNPSFAAGTFAAGIAEFRKLNEAEGIRDGERVRYFKGTFADVAARDQAILAKLQQAAIVNIDSDLCSSARDVLAIVADKLFQGSILLMDDWNCFAADPQQGERRALAEFLQAHTRFSVEPWFAYAHTGQAFIVHRR